MHCHMVSVIVYVLGRVEEHSYLWHNHVFHQSFVTTAKPTYGEGRGLRLFSCLCPAISPTPWGQTGGQNLFSCPALHNRKFPIGKVKGSLYQNPINSPAPQGQSKSNFPLLWPGYPPSFPEGEGARLQMTEHE